MALTPYQIVVPALSIIALSYAWNLWYRQRKALWEALLWTLFWGVIALIALYPRVLTILQFATGIKGQVNAILVTSIGILFFLVFYLVVRLEEVKQRQSKIIRWMALQEAGLARKEDKDYKEDEEDKEESQ